MAKESALQKKIRVDLEKSGWFVLKVTICNKPGFPDLTLMRQGAILFLEIKSVGKKAEPLQLHRHEELQKQGFKVFVIDTWEQYLQVKIVF
jgi:Holliday junction resolvase